MGHASTCNTTGQAIGVMFGSVFPILFASEDFCNKYLRVTPITGGFMTMKSNIRLNCHHFYFNKPIENHIRKINLLILK